MRKGWGSEGGVHVVVWRRGGGDTNFGGLLHVQPLAIVLQQELVAAGGVLECDHEDGTGAEDTHAGRGLVTAGDALQLVTGPHAEDGANLQSIVAHLLYVRRLI